jgi:hypothetical protein
LSELSVSRLLPRPPLLRLPVRLLPSPSARALSLSLLGSSLDVDEVEERSLVAPRRERPRPAAGAEREGEGG